MKLITAENISITEIANGSFFRIRAMNYYLIIKKNFQLGTAKTFSY